jgi:hypothetical protein
MIKKQVQQPIQQREQALKEKPLNHQIHYLCHPEGMMNFQEMDMTAMIIHRILYKRLYLNHKIVYLP